MRQKTGINKGNHSYKVLFMDNFMRLKTLYLCIAICLGLTMPILSVTTTPTTLLVQAKVTLYGDQNFNGKIPMTIGIFQPDIDDPPIWKERIEAVEIVNGNFSVVIGNSVQLNAEIFIDDNLRIGFTPEVNNDPVGTTFVPLKSVPYAFHSEISGKAEKFKNESLFKLDEVNSRIGINNSSPQYTLDVAGTINATTFIGDGSQLSNISVSDDRLVWLKSPTNPDNIYYVTGNVGIQTKNPSARLHVSGNAIVSGNLSVGGTIQATYLKGDGSQITNLNADQITTGQLNQARLSGPYSSVTGVGTLTSGVWEGTPITDQYVADDLTLNGATIEGNNTISGNFLVKGPTTIAGAQPVSISSNKWQVTADGDFTAESITIANQLEITGNQIISSSLDGFKIKPSAHEGIFISPTGSVGINTITPVTTLDVNGGLRLGDSSTEVDGMIRFKDDKFQGYRSGKWVQLDYEASFDSHALHSEGNGKQNLIYINDRGNIGLGGIPSANINDHVMTSGNVVMVGQRLGSNLPSLTTAGNGTRLIWYPKKSAFRAGYVENDQWNDSNIGVNSVVFGRSGLANANNAVIIGGTNNTNRSESAVMVGGYSNTIEANSDFSVMLGGGSSTGGGNTINGAQYGTIIGGQNNQLSGNYSTIIGGYNNNVSGKYSVAMGSNITIPHDGTIVFSDGVANRQSSDNNQFLIFAAGNVGINTPPSPDHALNVMGNVKATFFVGDGSQLTNIAATSLGGFAAETQASPNSIYVSNAQGFLPENTVSGLSIKDESITSVDIKDGSITGMDIKSYAIIANKIADAAITEEKIADGAITSSKIQDNAIASTNIKDGSIVSINIKVGAVKTNHIADLQVTNAKIALDTIDSSRIKDNTITSKDIGLSEIASFNIEENAIQSHHIEKSTIVSDNIAANAIQNQHIADNQVSSRNIADNSIFSNHITNYSIESRHITDNAILAQHIDDAVIINSRITDASITSDKIADNAIMSLHLPDRVIVTRHIAENAVLSKHIASGEIPGGKLADNAIQAINIENGAITNDKLADDSVTTLQILDGTITSADIGVGEIPGTKLAENSITSLNIAEGGIAGINIAENAINSSHIKDFSITSADIMDATIEANNTLDTNSISGDKIEENTIENRHLKADSISSKNIADNSIPWTKVTTDPIPNDRIADNSIEGSKLADGSINGSKIKDNTITWEKLADNSISANALIGTLDVDKGGTGITSFTGLEGAVLFGKSNNGSPPKTVLGGDSAKLYWNNTENRLGINTNTPEASLHVKGDILTEDGSVYFGNKQNSISIGEDGDDRFWIIGPDLSSGGGITATTEPNGALKTSTLYVKEKVGIGIQAPANNLEVSGNMAIGANYAGTLAPDNGLIVEGAVAIGKTTPAADIMLDVEGRIKAKGIFGKSTDGSSGIGIKGIGGKKGIVSNGSEIGIEVTASEIGIKTTSTAGTGVSVVINNAKNNDSTGILVELKDEPGTTTFTSGGIGKLTQDYSAAVFGTAGTDPGQTNWAGYFDGPVKITDKLGIGLASTESPDATLHIKGSAKIEKTIGTTSSSLTTTTIDWTTNSKWVADACTAATTYSFDNTTSLAAGSYLLTLIVKSTNNNCAITFSDNTILWEKGTAPSNSDTISNGTTAMFSFLLQKGTSDTYYAIGPVMFRSP